MVESVSEVDKIQCLNGSRYLACRPEKGTRYIYVHSITTIVRIQWPEVAVDTCYRRLGSTRAPETQKQRFLASHYKPWHRNCEKEIY